MYRLKRSCCMLALMIAILFIGAGTIQADEDQQEIVEKKPELTEHQQKELATLYQDLFDKRKGIINKYVEFGVIEKEKADKIIKKLDEHYRVLEKNGFIMDHKHHKGKHDHKFSH
ncbi:YckD family protein [Virgibacillus senegalensis]|uniref:YckD family protein n=1 Tax=Virgibacillus senegalensis TaxID=1499679 RepID=UPI00069E6D56|nr:YckD family protein [Virgibacillus senegalensis]